jgi:hypothetical protein
MNIKAATISFLVGLIQSIGAVYILQDPAPVHWGDLGTVKFVMAVIVFSSTNGLFAHKSFRDTNSRTRESDSFLINPASLKDVLDRRGK